MCAQLPRMPMKSPSYQVVLKMSAKRFSSQRKFTPSNIPTEHGGMEHLSVGVNVARRIIEKWIHTLGCIIV
jgi:hypothetical protein